MSVLTKLRCNGFGMSSLKAAIVDLAGTLIAVQSLYPPVAPVAARSSSEPILVAAVPLVVVVQASLDDSDLRLLEDASTVNAYPALIER